LFTKQFDLGMTGSEKTYDKAFRETIDKTPNCPDSTGRTCVLIYLEAFTGSTVSFVVSGSIVVIGNSVHWIEKQYECYSAHIN